MRARMPLAPTRPGAPPAGDGTRVSGRLLAFFFLTLLGFLAPARAAEPASAKDEDSAVVIMYHRFGEGRYPSTNVTLAQFEAHLAELKNGGYNVVPLARIAAAMAAKTPLPPRTVGISIDDGFVSVFTEAWPRLKKAGFPFTVFIATDYHERPIAGYMTWDQIRALAADPLVEIGNHSASHLSMAAADAEKSRADIARAQAAFREKLGRAPTLFAYPYGEASSAAIGAAREFGFVAGFGQHSGAFDSQSEKFYLPRFAFNENYSEIDRFRRAARARALPVRELVPADPLVAAQNPPAFGFTVSGEIAGLAQMQCYSSHDRGVQIERLGDRRFEVRFAKPFPKGRTRVNCTLPAGDGRWYWLGRQFYVPG